ncbi:outer membrane protein [Rhizobium halophytocola]|uniref:Outer membrane immunogenic protein n=1 Tax=Rhizobium halophytocola TaxID=735519 RepID=A0ABS4DVU0_9HYPH|nr:outer membrane protein [Rhizobium halophytocola]MBP1849802.1 outer membrane immunogenic protein [Rhizobium halophytocola]
MTKSVKPLALALVTALTATPVFAADLTYNEPAPSFTDTAAPSDWTGAYAGVNAGTASDRVNPFSGDKEFTGGLQAGYNTEVGGVIVGGEVELSHMGDASVDVPGGDLKERHRVAAKAKAGMPLGSTLIYGTAGVAMTNLRDGRNAEGPDGWKPGLLIGAGIEQKITGPLSAKVEYDYVRTGDVRTFSGGTTSESDISDHTIRAGLNYKF